MHFSCFFKFILVSELFAFVFVLIFCIILSPLTCRKLPLIELQCNISEHTSTALAWYINGLLAPELWLRRGLTYVFKVHGGNNPHSPEYYHPLIITDDPHGGYDRLTDVAQSKIRVLAGVEYSRRGRPKSTACNLVFFTTV